MPSYLLTRMLRSILVVASVCLAIALAASSVRLLPWIASDLVPWRVTFVFSQALALAAVEVALLVAPAVGVALELSRCSAEGTLTALSCAGASPMRLLAPIAIAAALAGLLSLLVSSSWGASASRPGALTNEMIAAGRPACPAQRVSESPLLGVRWLCVGNSPVLVGGWGAAAPSAGAWSASSIRLSDDLHRATLGQVQVLVRKPALRALFGHVTVIGLTPWTVASTLPGLTRGLAFAFAAICAALAVGWCLLRRPSASLALSLGLGASGPIAFLTAAPMLFDRGSLATLAGAVLLPSAVPLLACAAIRRLRLPVPQRGGTNS